MDMLQAVIFDLDGTVLDNEQVWEEAFLQVVQENRVKVNEMRRLTNGWLHEPGIGLVANWTKLVGDKSKAETLARETVNKYKAANGEVNIREGLEDLVAKIKERGWLTALATSSAWYMVEKELEMLDLTLAFDITTTGEEVLIQKPDPEIYTLTSQKLEVDPGACVIIEDAIAGVRAGSDAGMDVICLESEYAPKKLAEAAGAKWTIKSLDEVMAKLELKAAEEAGTIL